MKNDIARQNFKGIILVVDSDESHENAFDGYTQSPEIKYIKTVITIVKKVSDAWKNPTHGDNKKWWEVNQKAKLDKFVYLSLSHGFHVCHVCHEEFTFPALIKEPEVINGIRTVMNKY